MLLAMLEWSDAIHSITSPIAINKITLLQVMLYGDGKQFY